MAVTVTTHPIKGLCFAPEKNALLLGLIKMMQSPPHNVSLIFGKKLPSKLMKEIKSVSERKGLLAFDVKPRALKITQNLDPS